MECGLQFYVELLIGTIWTVGVIVKALLICVILNSTFSPLLSIPTSCDTLIIPGLLMIVYHVLLQDFPYLCMLVVTDGQRLVGHCFIRFV